MAEFTGDSISAVLDYPIDLYKAYYRAAIIERLNRTKEGKEYLKKAKRLATTTIDEKQFNEFKDGENKWLLI
ncbi:MAG: hypothetical protein MJZ55_00230 [Paludibacteraceae bacterium]|nr:hypothetical protein [Paludibacteraceae bacterium]